MIVTICIGNRFIGNRIKKGFIMFEIRNVKLSVILVIGSVLFCNSIFGMAKGTIFDAIKRNDV